MNFHDNFKAIKKIGKGTFANVYLCTHKFKGGTYAVKAFVKQKISVDEKGYACLYNELKIMRSMSECN